MSKPRGEAGLLLVVVLLAVLTIAGISLNWVTDTERIAAALDWSASRALYAADAGARWACAQMRAPAEFLARAEFHDPANTFGRVTFPIPDHRHGPGGDFSGDPSEDGIRVEVERPSFLSRRPCAPADPSGGFYYSFEVRISARETAGARYSRQIVADVEVGPLPDAFLPVAEGRVVPGPAASGDIIRSTQTAGAAGTCEPGGFRSVLMNWREP
jgi:hypothetical protein